MSKWGDGASLRHGMHYRNFRGYDRGPMDERAPGMFLDQHGTGYHASGIQWDHVVGSTGNIDLSTARTALQGSSHE